MQVLIGKCWFRSFCCNLPGGPVRWWSRWSLWNIWIYYYYIHIEICQLLKGKVASLFLDHFHVCNFIVMRKKRWVKCFTLSSFFLVHTAEYIDFVLFNSLFFLLKCQINFLGLSNTLSFSLFTIIVICFTQKKRNPTHLSPHLPISILKLHSFCLFFFAREPWDYIVQSISIIIGLTMAWCDVYKNRCSLGICDVYIGTLKFWNSWEKRKEKKKWK